MRDERDNGPRDFIPGLIIGMIMLLLTGFWLIVFNFATRMVK